jgi:signal peptidase I
MAKMKPCCGKKLSSKRKVYSMSVTTAKTPNSKTNSPTTKKSKLREYAESIIWALLIALFIRTFVVQAFVIPSGSMENTLIIGDHILVNKFIYGTKIPFTDSRILPLRDPKRGDVIVFEYPVDRSKDFIKRVIGVPGDEIFIRNKQVYVNGVPYRNPHELHKDPVVLPGQVSSRDNFGPVRVPANDFFVMGDNRDDSYDSRFWGFVKNSDILGLAFIKYWAWDKDTWTIHWGEIGRPIH